MAFGHLPLAGGALLDAYVSAERSEERSYKSYRDVLTGTALSLSRTFGIDPRLDSARRFADSVPLWPAFPDSEPVLRRLGKLGYQRYILSNVDTDMLRETIMDNRLEVDGFVTAEETRSYKPGLVHWRKFMQKSGAEATEILHVAQSVHHDLIPAQSLGIQTCWVNRYRERLPSGVMPLFIIDSLSSLPPLLS